VQRLQHQHARVRAHVRRQRGQAPLVAARRALSTHDAVVANTIIFNVSPTSHSGDVVSGGGGGGGGGCNLRVHVSAELGARDEVRRLAQQRVERTLRVQRRVQVELSPLADAGRGFEHVARLQFAHLFVGKEVADAKAQRRWRCRRCRRFRI
jgi:hypothetical protein